MIIGKVMGCNEALDRADSRPHMAREPLPMVPKRWVDGRRATAIGGAWTET
jgi:hypothetical protein